MLPVVAFVGCPRAFSSVSFQTVVVPFSLISVLCPLAYTKFSRRHRFATGVIAGPEYNSTPFPTNIYLQNSFRINFISLRLFQNTLAGAKSSGTRHGLQNRASGVGKIEINIFSVYSRHCF